MKYFSVKTKDLIENVRVRCRPHYHLEDIDIVQNQIRKSKCSVVFQNGEIQITRYLLKDVLLTYIDENFFSLKNRKSSRGLLVLLIGSMKMTV